MLSEVDMDKESPSAEAGALSHVVDTHRCHGKELLRWQRLTPLPQLHLHLVASGRPLSIKTLSIVRHQ